MGKILTTATEAIENMEVTVREFEPTPEYKKAMEEANERIREDKIRQAKAIRRAADFIAL